MLSLLKLLGLGILGLVCLEVINLLWPLLLLYGICEVMEEWTETRRVPQGDSSDALYYYDPWDDNYYPYL